MQQYLRRPAGSDVLPHVYRITRYDPADRDQHGHYIGAEAEISDHGPVEAAYLMAVAAFAEDTGVGQLAIREPEISGFAHVGPEPAVDGHGMAGLFPHDLAGFHDGAQVPVEVGLEIVRAMLRDNGAWCRLEVEGRISVHVGWDQYLYVGSSRQCEAALARTRALGLFPERLDASPYDFDLDQQHVQRPADADFWARLRWVVSSHRATLLEETYVRNASRWHRLTYENIETVRGQLAPRAQLAVWPDLLTEVDGAVAALPDEGTVEILWEDANGRIAGTIADETRFEAVTRRITDARAAAVIPITGDERLPLLTAVLPDSDGILRARWRTEPTPSDRDWAFLKTLRRGQLVTGTVKWIADFGVTFVDIGGFTAMINIPELSWRPFDHPTEIVSVGQEITAEVLDVDMSRERVPLSLRAVQEDPWPQLTQRIGQVVTGPVTKVVRFGLFVRIEDREDGIAALVHIEGLADTPVERSEHAVRVGDILTVKILDVDVTRRTALACTQSRPADG
ncbi:S1 RNA-binding domain-containing protein [Streptomyces sp. NBC_01767]|uniref:S1 RNA-binding domain-containing protein n=1 Tax=Streptomyces sp. NBC_01767 TaxID=2975937 RepID=UPI0022537163|nr:S1 RNA-binding domain-containing protein [Streptomyces sp. NBC_01767]MCX4399087.1 S1 RNA-binding domain-containing protein [Streptomyces sp. NBC_01767]